MDPSSSPPPGNAAARGIVISMVLLINCVLGIFFLDDLLPWLIPYLCYALPVLLLSACCFTGWLARKGVQSPPRELLVLGCLYIAGGAIFDTAVTRINKPDVPVEDNFVEIALRETGHPDSIVRLIDTPGQILFISFLVLTWIALLRHRSQLAATIPYPSTVGVFLKAAMGGSSLTWRQTVFPQGYHESPWAYHTCWLNGAMLMAGAGDRWYLGLEAFGLPSSLRWTLVLLSLILGVTGYLVWLRRASRIQHDI